MRHDTKKANVRMYSSALVPPWIIYKTDSALNSMGHKYCYYIIRPKDMIRRRESSSPLWFSRHGPHAQSRQTLLYYRADFDLISEGLHVLGWLHIPVWLHIVHAGCARVVWTGCATPLDLGRENEWRAACDRSC